MPRIIVLSDVHLSPTHRFFWKNWCIARDFANAAEVEAVIVNGDLTINGADGDAEVAFAAEACNGLRAPVFALPGNHDVGDEPPGQDPEQIINVERLARWDREFGIDHWVRQAGSWALIGLNAQLFGSELERELEQSRWLDGQLIAAERRPIAVFLHKPLFIDQPDEDGATAGCLVPAARAGLLARLRHSNVQLIVSGHLHEHRERIFDGTRHVWAPAVAFAAPELHGGDGTCGLLTIEFSADTFEITVEKPAGLVSHDLAELKGHGRYKFLRHMPTSPPCPNVNNCATPTSNLSIT
jgi:3',5'-cyclic AMP phosphodiesterase CpdA